MWHASVREAPLRAVGQNGPRGPTRASKARTSGPVPFPLQHALLIRITPLHLRRLPDRAEVAELEDGVQPSLVRSNHDERQRAARPPSELRLPDAEHAGRHGDQNSMGMTRRDERRDEGDGSEGLAKARIIAQHRPALLLRAEEEAHAEQLVQLERFENAGRQQREPSTSPQHAPASNKAAASRLQSQAASSPDSGDVPAVSASPSTSSLSSTSISFERTAQDARNVQNFRHLDERSQAADHERAAGFE
eukprot:CAMPEP_0181187764 /NCGR_PEP_ID=MMETSP1096-20121128/10751_1 /TAXON_ID=156174 ORGANISM="Chrysochromulina ericina, Strain CCMP281" /NCGR_SAMPLE_ID=MMETSP1096 /ASSEMBLY_ACC=CAM_ASM_000453 /LENGTH=248 /DNA_ID=CAMNT_0023276769 /DNA_START=146 /DNA_END=890 /DNA_ORIENTATION=-